MSVLLSAEEADFVYLKEKTEATAGNLSVQLDKLASAGYIEKETDGSGSKPRRGWPTGHAGICSGAEDLFLGSLMLRMKKCCHLTGSLT